MQVADLYCYACVLWLPPMYFLHHTHTHNEKNVTRYCPERCQWSQGWWQVGISHWTQEGCQLDWLTVSQNSIFLSCDKKYNMQSIFRCILGHLTFLITIAKNWCYYHDFIMVLELWHHEGAAPRFTPSNHCKNAIGLLWLLIHWERRRKPGSGQYNWQSRIHENTRSK